MAIELEEHQKQQIAELWEHPGMAELRAWVIALRTQFLENLGRELYANPDKVTESLLREKKAYFAGMMRVLNEPYLRLEMVTKDLRRRDGVTDGD